MKKTAFLIVVSSLLFGCGTQQSSVPKPVEKKVAPSNPPLAITNVQVTKNDGQNIDVSLTVDNITNKAIYVHSSDFALSTGTITLSPTSQSNVPAQIPANSNTNITLSFDVQGQLSGTIEPKLDFQPSDNQPEQFESLGSVNIPVPQNPVSKPTTSDSTTKPTQPISITIVQPSTTKPNGTDSSEYILPGSDYIRLTEIDIANLTLQQLRLARNEIYARHGYIFKSEDLQSYFSQKTWYSPDPSFDGSTLSEVEKYNVQLILSRERSLQ
jgi:hypothetical protein